LALTGAGSASAASLDAPSLSITTSPPTAAGGSTVTLTGWAAPTSYLWAYYQPAGTPCGATVHSELLMQDGVSGVTNFMNGVTVPTGPFSLTRTVNFPVGSDVVCGYLSSLSSDPSAPGPTYKVPDAAAVSQPVTVGVCTPTTFSITSVVVDPKSSGSNWYPFATLTVHADGPGGFQLYTVDPAGTATPIYGGIDATANGGNATWQKVLPIDVSWSTPAQTVTQAFRIEFGPAVYGRCVHPDGTIGSSDEPFPTKDVRVTYTYLGGGSSDVGPGTAHVVPSISVNPYVVTFGQIAYVTIKGTPGATVDLYTRKYLGSFAKIRDGLVLDSTGRTVVATRPDVNLRFLAKDRTLASGSSISGTNGLMTVRKSVSLAVTRVGTRTYRFAGTINPMNPGATVSVYRGSTLVKSGIPVSSARTYSFTTLLPVGTFAFQTRSAASGYSAASTSPVRSTRIY
jgi:hypothetical protein